MIIIPNKFGITVSLSIGMANKIDAPSSSEWFIPVKNRTIESAALFKTGKELCILHNDAEYKLRLTGNGKLILTK